MRTKDYNLELIRMASFVLVIAIHVSNYFCRAYGQISDGEYLFSLVIDTFARVSVPCFFMISGALLLGRDEPLSKHWKRLRRFFLALVVWSVIYYLWNTFYMKSDFDLREIFYVPAEAHLWYLYAMIPIYLTLPFLQVLCRNMSRQFERAFLVIATAAVLINYILWLFGAELYYDLPLIGDRVYAYYLYLGYHIYKYRDEIRVSQKWTAFLCFAGMAVSFGVTYGVTVLEQDHYEGALTYAMPSVILSGAAFFLYVLRVKDGHFQPKEKARQVIDLFGGLSFGIYLIHILFLDNYKKYMEPWDLSAWIAVPGLILTITAVSFVCVYVLRLTKVGRKIT